MRKFGDLFWLIFVVVYLFIRDYPFGGILQSILDGAILLTLILMVMKYVLKKEG